MTEKKGLVIVYDPHTLQQFTWYYYTYCQNKKWDALCLPDGYKGAYMEPYCKRIGIFEKIMKGETEYLSLALSKKLSLICQMTGYFLIGKRKICAKKILNDYVGNIDEYDEIVCLCDTGFISGLCAMLGNEKTISYLDDGLGDYNPRTKWSNTFKKNSATYWQSLVLDRMGYSCKGRFWFEPTKYCYKYSAVPNEMLYRNYKEIRSFDMSHTDVKAYNEALLRAYPNLKKIDFEKIDTVFFTDNLETFSNNYQVYYDKCTNVIGNNSKTVLLKRHPRDGATYNFPDNIKVVEMDNAIPAEIMLPYLKEKQIYFSYFSSIIIFMQQYEYTYKIFYSEQLYQDNQTQKNCTWHFLSKNRTIELCEKFSKNRYTMINV